MSHDSSVQTYDDMLAWPFALGGRGANGIDCLGVCVEVWSRLGIPAIDPWEQLVSESNLRGRRAWARLSHSDRPTMGWKQATSPWMPGDVGEHVGNSHVSAYVGDGWWISAASACNGVYRFAENGTQRNSIRSVWRWRC